MIYLHVVPHWKNGMWSVRKSGATRSIALFGSRDEAIADALWRAYKNNMDLYIHRLDGTVERTVGFVRPGDKRC